MVDNPDQIKINEIEGEHVTVLELTVDRADIGKVIGKQGRNVNAIRTILISVAAKHREKVELEIMD
jgi:predicted RNA-binding protein YlqC (UPF0109 family)